MSVSGHPTRVGGGGEAVSGGVGYTLKISFL